MTLTVVCARLRGGGPHARTLHLLRRLGERDHKLRVVTTDSVAIDGVDCCRVTPWSPRSVANALRACRQPPDVVYVPINWLQAAAVRAVADAPLVVGPGVKHDWRGRRAADLLTPAHIIDTHEYVAWLWQVSGHDATPIYPGVDRRLFSPDAFGGDGWLFVGRLTRAKGAHLVAELADDTGRDVTVIGDGPLRERVERSAARYLGRVPNNELPAHYRAASVTLVPSVSESFSIVALESIACGTPVVTTAVSGSMHRLFHGEGVYRWCGRDAASLARAARDVERDGYAERVQAGLDLIDDRELTVEAMTDRFHRVCEAV